LGAGGFGAGEDGYTGGGGGGLGFIWWDDLFVFPAGAGAEQDEE